MSSGACVEQACAVAQLGHRLAGGHQPGAPSICPTATKPASAVLLAAEGGQ